MIKVLYSEQDTPEGMALRLEAEGHAGYAPEGQDIVCAGASTLMQALVYMLASEPNTKADAWDEPEGPRMSVSAGAPVEPWVSGAFELAKAGFALLAERYPENLRFADISRRGKQAMLDLQLFAEGGDGSGDGSSTAAGTAAPALSRAQAQQAAASGTLKAAKAEQPAAQPAKPAPQREDAQPPEPKPQPPRVPPMPPQKLAAVRQLHARWAAEEAAMRRAQPGFSLQNELKNPEMRRLMQLPGMRMQDAWRLAHYSDTLRGMAQAVEQGVMERIRQRGARPAENGAHASGAAVARPDVAGMTRAQREALERQALHGAQIRL